MACSQRDGGECGAWIFVAGPSGAGKDTLMNFASHELQNVARLRLARRMDFGVKILSREKKVNLLDFPTNPGIMNGPGRVLTAAPHLIGLKI